MPSFNFMQIYIIFRRSPNLHFALFLQKLTVLHSLLLSINLHKRLFLQVLFLRQKSKCMKKIKAENEAYYLFYGTKSLYITLFIFFIKRNYKKSRNFIVRKVESLHHLF